MKAVIARTAIHGVWLSLSVLPASALAQQPSDTTDVKPGAAKQLDTVMVTGSNIPRAQIEGPAPITVIDAQQIKANGFASVPDVLRALTQNGGETQSQQSSNGAQFTPGAQQVDLRGLGANHTLVLVNGRRIADFPLPLNGRSNFTDISNIPLAMIERIEVLSGSASAVYGSDAIAGVVNFILKKKADGTTLDYRYGDTTHGGGASHRLALSSGWSHDGFDAIVGAELLYQKPLWAFQRPLQDSTARDPTATSTVARRTFLREDPVNQVYIDPGAATCAQLGSLNRGSTYYASRPNWGADAGPGYYCGSDRSIGYGTIESQRKGINAYASLNLQVNPHLQLFTDIQAGFSKVSIFNDVLKWQYQDANGGSDGVFYNQATGALDSWYRQFTPEESGGLGRGMITNIQRTLSITPGAKGSFGDSDWSYEASYNHSQYRSSVSWPQIVAAKANSLYLGPQLGVDADSGYPIFHADPSRLYTPLSRSEFDSIATRSNYSPRSRSDNLSLTINTPKLFELPAGPVGFASVAEYGKQGYRLSPDPLALTNYYYGLRDADGSGSRDHWGLGYEFRAPIFSTLDLSAAGRYDRYRYAGNDAGKFTYNFGLEWRPVESLLVRGSYGTGFRAPDLHYVFAGNGNTHPSATDYYLCRTLQPGSNIGDCSYADNGIVETRSGNRKLKDETSRSLTAGFVWSPLDNLDVSLDYFRIRLANEVLDMNIDSLLRQEADCRIGRTADGSAVDSGSPTCQDALARVTRNSADSAIAPNGLVGVRINPINVARESTSGYDFTGSYRLPTSIGTFRLRAAYTWVKDHTIQRYPGDPTIDQFAVDSGYDIPRSKASASLSWESGRWTATVHGQRLGPLPNYASTGFIGATYLYNGSLQYKLSDHAQIAFTVDNLLDKKPPRDPTYSSYPYYDVSWFDSEGRSYFVQLTYKFGGGAL